MTTPVASGAVLAGAWNGEGMSLRIPKGKETFLAETGMRLHLTGLKQALELGRSYPLKLVFEKGGTVNVDLSVDYAALG